MSDYWTKNRVVDGAPATESDTLSLGGGIRAEDMVVVDGSEDELILELGKAQLAASLISDARETLMKASAQAPASWQAQWRVAICQVFCSATTR